MTTEQNHHPLRPRRRGESSIGNKPKDISVTLKAAASVGKVTRARFEPLREHTGEAWGVVHLYRGGDSTPGLGGGVEEVYHVDSSSAKSAATGKATASADPDYGNEDECTILCVPAVPAYFSPSDFLGFVDEKTREQVSHFRMVMTGQDNMYLVLMKFNNGGFARRWKTEWDGKLFNSLEPEACYVTYIKSITFQTEKNSKTNNSFPELSYDPFSPSNSAFTSIQSSTPLPANITEVPTCPVCLDRMDDSTGLVTILCQHVFHGDCIKKWRGSGCPVCRRTNPALASTSFNYDPANPPFGSGESPFCSTCDSAEDLWICLLCGNVGCGRYKGGHQKDHWKATAHNLALEIETQYIWDYADDKWAHRSIRQKDDSKIMDEPRSISDQGPLEPQAQMTYAQSLTSSDAGKEAHHPTVPSEHDVEMRLGYMLQPILDQQRAYFEEQMALANSEATAATAAEQLASDEATAATIALEKVNFSNATIRAENQSLTKDLVREKSKSEKSTVLAKSMTKAFQEEKRLSEGLLENNTRLQKLVKELEAKIAEQKGEIGELEEQVRDLYLNFEARDKLQAMDLEEGELEGGSLVANPGKGKGRGRKK
ncbi:hypothetical protein BJ878DRAFT_205097 [Calycina marina]|uniref:Uncharacterized protein n=1 Tax=Calycina marina TaxID=1763456 RepID=A0A9P7Z843_9HELO|nr:hypothetical protein BJ878DRAFT_205097 [Calycina marina]